ncbi:MAG: NAD-dependent epimerase/dehydratase family protein [Rhodothermales bacterium]|nr:NAD-dependent epimerase/dehydratase family protein [Rhodothermales bacterium]
MNYFLTGATGFIGGHLARLLLNEGHGVVALVRSPEKAQDLKALGATLAMGDITEKETMRGPMAGVDGVFHLAAWYKVGARDASRAERINVGGTRNVLELMRELEIPKGVYTSTLAVFSDTGGRRVDETYRYDGPHLSTYDRTKWQAHYEVALPMIEDGLPLVIVQPGAVYGPGDPSAIGDAFRSFLKGQMPMVPKETAFCWAHVEDVARGHLLAMEKGTPGEAYIIAGPCHTLEAVIEKAAAITGRKAPSFRVGAPVMRGLARMMDAVGAVVPLPAAYTGESLRVTAGVTYLGDNAKAKRALGYRPRSLDDGLPETLQALQAE